MVISWYWLTQLNHRQKLRGCDENENFCQNWSKLINFDQKVTILRNFEVLYGLRMLVMSTELSTKVGGYINFHNFHENCRIFVIFWWKMIEIDKIVNLRILVSLMNPNRKCQNRRFRRFWWFSRLGTRNWCQNHSILVILGSIVN